MGETTKIQWADKTFSPWRGCTKVAPECANCYAAVGSVRNPGTLGVWGPNGTRVVAADKAWREVEKWDREAAAKGVRYRVFPSLCDPFEDWKGPVHNHKDEPLAWCPCGTFSPSRGYQKPICDGCNSAGSTGPATMADVRRRYFDLIDRTPNLDHLLLTKRPENIREMWPGVLQHCCGEDRTIRPGYRPNVWLLASAGSQPTLDKFAPALQQCRDLCPVIGYSAEPLLEATDYRLAEYPVDIIITGGESGHGARPCDIAWIRSIRDQCRVAGNACFIKQMGANSVIVLNPHDEPQQTEIAFRDKKGGDSDEWPADLRVREFPCSQ